MNKVGQVGQFMESLPANSARILWRELQCCALDPGFRRPGPAPREAKAMSQRPLTSLPLSHTGRPGPKIRPPAGYRI